MAEAQEDFDRDALQKELRENVESFSGLRGIHKFDTGQSNPTYRVDAESGTYVLRAKPAGKLLKSAHQVDREHRVMAALRDTRVPVPRVLYLSGEESAIGRMFFVMDHLDGRIFWDPALPELEKAGRAAVYDAMNQALADLHTVDIAAVGLSDFGRPGNYFERQYRRWSDQYRQSAIDPLDDMEALIDWLGDNMPADDGAVALVHGDWRMDNMIFAKDEPRIMGVLDWELSTLGHPLADLAYQCMQLRLPHESGFRGLGGVDRNALGLPGEAEYVAAYCRRRGIGRIGNWPFYLAFAFFRLAAILQGVYRRAIDGNASNPARAREMGASIPLIAAAAMRVLQEDR